MSAPTRFELRFPITEVSRIANGYDIKEHGDDKVEPLGLSARERGYLTREEFLALCAWKTERSKSRCSAKRRGVNQ